MRNMTLERDVIAGLEWSINEITDNVLNHAECSEGGIAQGRHFTRNVAFVVADAGRGVLASLREGHPELRTDDQAIGEAMKAGVTRNPDAGQGNGIAGAMRIAMMSEGFFQITSVLAQIAARLGLLTPCRAPSSIIHLATGRQSRQCQTRPRTPPFRPIRVGSNPKLGLPTRVRAGSVIRKAYLIPPVKVPTDFSTRRKSPLMVPMSVACVSRRSSMMASLSLMVPMSLACASTRTSSLAVVSIRLSCLDSIRPSVPVMLVSAVLTVFVVFTVSVLAVFVFATVNGTTMAAMAATTAAPAAIQADLGETPAGVSDMDALQLTGTSTNPTLSVGSAVVKADTSDSECCCEGALHRGVGCQDR